MTTKSLPKFCNRCQEYFDVGQQCACYGDEISPQELKLYKVTVHVVGKGGSVTGVPFGYRCYILDINSVQAQERVVAYLGTDRISPDHMPETEEVKGPFSKGQVLFWDEF